MPDTQEEIITAQSLVDTARLQQAGYITHALCLKGSCQFDLGSAHHTVLAGDCLIIPQQSLRIRNLNESPDLQIEVIYVVTEFIAQATPQSNYGMQGHIALFENPIMHLRPEQQKVCAINFEYIRHRLQLPHHHFHRDAMLNAIQCMIIDFFVFHVELYGERQVTNQQAKIMQDFMALLERGDYRQHRQVSYYASEICVSPKYLSEVCHRVSGQPAIYWITRYTTLEISRLLRQPNLTLEQISDQLEFSSPSHLVRYVKKNLGAPPSEFRS